MAHRFSPLPAVRARRAAPVAGLLLAVTLALGGCASVPPPDAAMSQAQAALQAASQVGANDYDPVDLGFAQDKFQQAQMAMADNKYARAADLAAESSADATLARTRALLGAVRQQIALKTLADNRLREQNQQAKIDNTQHAEQLQAQLAQQQAAVQAAAAADQPGQASSAPAPASTTPVALPMQAPVQQMAAPPPAVAAPLPQGGSGFQTVPDTNKPGNTPASGSTTISGGQS